MTALPAAAAFTGAGVTEGAFKSAITDQRAFLAGLLGVDGLQATALAAMGAPLNGVIVKAAAYTVVAADRGKLIDSTGTWTLTLTAAATLGAGFTFSVRNSGSGVITIDPNGGELVNGEATITVTAKNSVLVITDGVSWKTVGGGSASKSVIVTDGSDIVINDIATGYNNFGSSFVATIPADGYIGGFFSGRLRLDSVTAASMSLGIRIGAVNYWLGTYKYVINGAGEVTKFPSVAGASGVLVNDYYEFSGTNVNSTAGGVRSLLSVGAAGIPAGSQTIQIIVAGNIAGASLRGTTKLSRVYLDIVGE